MPDGAQDLVMEDHGSGGRLVAADGRTLPLRGVTPGLVPTDTPASTTPVSGLIRTTRLGPVSALAGTLA